MRHAAAPLPLLAAAIAASVAMMGVTAAAAAEGSLRFEKTVAFQTDKLVALDAQVGPVRVSQVQFSTGGGGVKESIIARVRGGGDSETSTTLRASFDSENPTADEWEVTYTLEFLDRAGELIDRVSKSESFEGEGAVYKLEHSILAYVVPFIAKVKIRLEAQLD